MTTDQSGTGRFCAVVLAAGESKRFGSPKQVALIEGEPLIRRVARACRDAGADEVIVVLGAHIEAAKRALQDMDCRIVEHAQWRRGMTSSFQAGLRACDDLGAHFALVPGDMARLRSPHVRAVLDAARAAFTRGARLLVPVAGGKRGHPVAFHRELREALAALPQAAPLHDYVRSREDRFEWPTLDEAYLFNLNRREDLEPFG